MAITSSSDRVPPAMRTEEARQLLVNPQKINGFNSLKLYPAAFLKTPKTTFRHLCLGLRHYPALTLSHLLQGARWSSRPQIDVPQYVAQLLERFNLPSICQSLPDA